MVGLNKQFFRLFMALFILAGMTLLTYSVAKGTRAAMKQANQAVESNLNSYYLPLIQRNGTTLCGEITTDTTWGITGTPYRVSCDVIVSTHVTLTIEAGALVQFEHPDDDLIISGTLQAEGTEYAPIRFQTPEWVNAR